MSSRGAVYIASGEKYLEEAKKSVRSLKENNPGMEATLYTDEDVEIEGFDQIIQIDRSIENMTDSILDPEMMPYDKNIFLDSDTYITDNVSELFELLEHRQIAFTKNLGRGKIEGLPECVTEYNTGVIAYRNTGQIKELFKEWKETQLEMEENGVETGRDYGNQHSFTKTLFQSDIRPYILPEEYNTRIPICGYLGAKTKIIHGRPRTNYEKVEKNLNSLDEARIHYPTQSITGSGRKVRKYSFSYKIQRTINIIKSHGITQGLEIIKGKIR